MSALICVSCKNWNHWHDTPDGSCDDPRCECSYRKEPHKSNKIMADQIESAGNLISGLDLSGCGEDGHRVANLLWKISGYVKGRASG